jgi:Glyoxalase-like domain
MTGQLPGQGQVFLDHVAHFAPVIEPAAEALERCGFHLTPFTVQTNRVDGKPVAAGTGNRCAMFRRGYIEILVATSDTLLSRQLTERLARHIGIHLAAFSTADAASERERLVAAGFPMLPLVDMRRPVGSVADDQWARFTIARMAPGIMPEGRIQFLTHHTAELVWRDPFLDHPNGALMLAALWIAATDPAEPASRFARFTGRPVRQEDEVSTIRLDRGTVRVATADYLESKFGIDPRLPLPHLAAYEVTVESLPRLRECLDAAGVTYALADRTVALPLPASIGGTILFREMTA